MGRSATRGVTGESVRIAVVADDLYPGFGGQAVATEGHIEALRVLGHELVVLAGAEKKPSRPPPGVRVLRVPAWQPGEVQTKFALPDVTKVAALLRDAEVVQINTPTPLGFVALRLAKARGLPCVVGFHTQEESATLHFKPPLANAVGFALRSWYRFFYSQADALSVPTPFAARLARRYTGRPCFVVSNGIRFGQLRALDESEVARRRQKYLGGKRFLLAYVGRLAPEKRPRDLLELAVALRSYRQDLRLLVAGRGPLQAELERYATSLGLGDSVEFLGFVSEEEKRYLLRASDVFVMPSPTELQSIATLEAMTQGCAVLAAEVESSAVSEMVVAAGCGQGYPVGDMRAAAATLQQWLEEPEHLTHYQDKAVSAAKTHDLSGSGRALERIYRDLLNAKHHLEHQTT